MQAGSLLQALQFFTLVLHLPVVEVEGFNILETITFTEKTICSEQEHIADSMPFVLFDDQALIRLCEGLPAHDKSQQNQNRSRTSHA